MRLDETLSAIVNSNSVDCPQFFRRFLGRGAPRRFERTDAFVLAVFAALAVAYFLPALGAGLVVSNLNGDVASLSLFKRAYVGEALLHGGKGLLWNPFIFSGLPFLSTAESAEFYPATWLFALLPAGPCMNFVFILHSWLGLAAMYGFARWLGLSKPNPQGVLFVGANPLARALAVLEGMVGQLYVAVLIARLVGIHTAGSQRT